MPTSVLNKDKDAKIPVVKKMRDYSEEQAFKKKAEKAAAFLKKHGLPKTSGKKKK